MITLERTRPQAPLKAIIQEGERNEVCTCSLTFCENPLCTCASIGFILEPEPRPGAENSEASATVSFSLDLERRAVDETKRALDAKSRSYAKLFINGLREDDWQVLQDEYITYKTNLTETADPAGLKTNFPVEDVEDGVMVPYHEILPFGKRLLFTLNGVEYILSDQYCVRTGCTCVDSSASFVALEKRWLVRNRNNLENVRINYRTRKWDFTEVSGKSSFTQDELRAAVEAAHAGLYGILRDRHEQLKALYRLFRKRHAAVRPELAPAPLKTGRNAPCPCGSGKKYKRCCGK